MRNENIMIRWLWFLRICFILNFIFGAYCIFISKDYWWVYFIVNAGFIFGYIWFNYIRLFVYEFTHDKYSWHESDEGYSVIVPCFNEESDLLKQAIRSVLETDNNPKEILIIDDGSTNGIWATIQEIARWDRCIKIFRFEKNQGKRAAHKLAVSKSKYALMVSIDSDTIIGWNAIRKLIAPFSNEKIGATTGNVILRNEKQNWLTRIQAGFYWTGMNISKKGQSVNGCVACCSGCLSAYRKSDLLEVEEQYVNQTFLGKKCRASEDRHLTNLMNEKGYDVVFVQDAYCYTKAPFKLRQFVKQQRRWIYGSFRENLYTLTYAWGKSKPLFFESILFWLMPIVVVLPSYMLTYASIWNPINFLYLIPFWFLLVFCRNILFFLESPATAFRYLPFVFIHLFIIYPLQVVALFNVNPEKWGTR